MCRKHVLMSLLALGWVPANLCWSQTDPLSPPPPQVELQAHAVDGVDLLRAIAEVAPFNLVAVREGHPARIDIPAHAALMEGVWADIIARSGLQRAASNGYEVVGNACRLPLSTDPGHVLPDKNRLTLHFNKIPTDLFFALMAQVQDLELDAPEGLPAADLAMLIRSRPADEILETVDNLLALDTHIDGRRLVVKRKPGPRACLMTGSEAWQATLPKPAALTQSLNKLLQAYSQQMDQPCPRLADFPDTAKQSCDYLEYFPLEKLSMRGYIRLAPESPISVLVESPESSLHRVWSGDPVGDQAGVIGWVDTDKVNVLERLGSAQPYADETEKETEIRFATGERRIHWVLRAYTKAFRRGYPRDWLEHYALEDLLVRSTQEVQGKWQATVMNPFGLATTVVVNNYVGLNEGKITQISAKELHLEEIVPDHLGGYMTRNIVITPGVRYEEPRKAIKRKYEAPLQNTPAQSAFIFAAGHSGAEQLERFIQLGVDIDAVSGRGDGNALIEAIIARRRDTVAWLLARGARVNILTGRYEKTPLIVAASVGDQKIVEQLIKAGADLNLADDQARTAIQYALDNKSDSVTRLLVTKGANLKSWDDFGVSPLTQAASQGRVDTVRFFLEHGATIADRDRSGYTLLAAAVQGDGKVQGDNRKLVATLIGLGSDVNARSRQGESVLDLAQARNPDPEIIAMLLSHGARSAQSETAAE